MYHILHPLCLFDFFSKLELNHLLLHHELLFRIHLYHLGLLFLLNVDELLPFLLDKLYNYYIFLSNLEFHNPLRIYYIFHHLYLLLLLKLHLFHSFLFQLFQYYILQHLRSSMNKFRRFHTS